MVNSMFSSVNRPAWRTVAVICVCISILGVGAYFVVSTRISKDDESASIDEAQPAPEREPSNFREELKSGVLLEETRITVPEPGGEPGWSFGAEKIEYDPDNNRACLVDAEGIRFIHARPEIEIRAGVVKLDLESGNVDFEDRVTVKSKQGPSFSAKGATWDPGTKKFRAYGDIRYNSGSSEIFGDEIEIDLELETARVKGNVRFRSPALPGLKGGFAR